MGKSEICLCMVTLLHFIPLTLALVSGQRGLALVPLSMILSSCLQAIDLTMGIWWTINFVLTYMGSSRLLWEATKNNTVHFMSFCTVMAFALQLKIFPKSLRRLNTSSYHCNAHILTLVMELCVILSNI